LRLAQNDLDAFGEFYDTYAEQVVVFFGRRVFDAETAFDLMSETFTIALDRRGQFRGRTPQEEQGWLFAIARSALLHFWRRGAVEKAAMRRLDVPEPALTSAEIQRIEQLSGLDTLRPRLLAAMELLPADQRRAVILRVVAELGYEEISAELDVSEEVGRARVSRGLRALRERLPDADHILQEIT
jgi:RNA polymerase sigma-70 factor (ECF subfamily)